MASSDYPMSPNRPYLIRGLYDWIADNSLTPHLLADAAKEGVTVPERAVKDGKVVLNISSSAVRGLELGNELISFKARFGGRDYAVSIPTEAVLAIYAKENGQGMLFPQNGEEPPPAGPAGPDNERNRPKLRVVK